MVWRREDPQGNEAGKIRWELVKWTRGKGLDIGCGAYKAFPHFIGLDNGADIALFGHQFRPDVWIDDATDLRLFATDQFDFVFSSHLLEHIEESKVVKALKEWLRVIKVGGHLILYLPADDLYPKVGEEGANRDHKWNVNYDVLIEVMEKAGHWDLRDFQKRDQGTEYSLYFVFQKRKDGHLHSWSRPKPNVKRAGVVRYGAYGDVLQASSVFSGLKQQGYHVTVFCSAPGSDVILHDPNIDEFYYQDKDQVPNTALGDFWAYHEKRFDKWVNLSESAEGNLLAIPGRSQHMWPPAARHRMMDINYLEFQHLIAGVPHVPAVKFYATDAEREWAKTERAKRPGFTVVWSMAGSAVHKKWLWVDNVIATMLVDYPDIQFVIVGGPDCILLEQGWFKTHDGEPLRDIVGRRIMVEPRVLCTSGEWSIRETMAFCEQADLIIGPETGVLNMASMLPIPKVVFLSHSTDENLTRDWVNTHVLYSDVTECPGRGKNEAPACHQLHYSWEHCKQADGPDGLPMGIAQCQADIPPELVIKVLWHAIQHAKEAKAA